ncbi:MAG: NTP transferase domain-containing protein [Candidatus Omnitrophica bacterium]|nr:NTP transferase domain-containing protein [Candidatus Omnitrophota bacterium]
MVDLVVLCGGRGSRLGSLTENTPKPLLPVAGRPFLLHLLLKMREQGFGRILLAAHYLPDLFRSFLSEYSVLLPDLQLILEHQPLGTGGALAFVARQVRGRTFVAMNGDSWVSQAAAPVLEEHQRLERKLTFVAVKAQRVEGGAIQKGVWRLDREGRPVGFSTESAAEGWVNGGLYVFDREIVASWPEGAYSLEENLLSLIQGVPAGLYYSDGRLLDIGTPELYEWANRAWGQTAHAH